MKLLCTVILPKHRPRPTTCSIPSSCRFSKSTMAAPPRPAQTQPAGKKLINLLRGWPSPHLLPAERLRAATNHVLSDPATSVLALQYGLDPGYQPLRQELAQWLGGAYGQGGDDDAADPERLCVTGGASQGLACILASFSEPGHTLAVWVSAPCYFMACPIFEDAGFAGRMRAVAEDEEGVDLVALEEGMRREEARAEENGPVSWPVSIPFHVLSRQGEGGY